MLWYEVREALEKSIGGKTRARQYDWGQAKADAILSCSVNPEIFQIFSGTVPIVDKIPPGVLVQESTMNLN